MTTVDHWLNLFVTVCINICLGVISFLVIMQVTFRFVINSPLPWPEELSRLVFIYLVFIGGAASSRSQTHISIDLLDNMLPPNRIRFFFDLVRNMLTFIVLVATAYGAVAILPNIGLMRLPATGLPMTLMIFPILIGSVLMMFWTARHLIQDFSSVLSGNTVQKSS